MNSEGTDIHIPLVVDLDGTLIKTDILYEGLLNLIKTRPLYIFLCIFWLFKGKLNLKKKIFQIVNLKYELLPFNKELLCFLKRESLKGRKLILATASLDFNAQEIMKITPILDEAYGSKDVNLKGKNKLDFLIKKFGVHKFDYIGNSASDIVICAYSRYSFLINPSKSLVRKTKKISTVKMIWETNKQPPILTFLKAIRIYQWVKNLLIFVPLLASHSFNSLDQIIQSLIGFFAFSLIASSGYVLNDLLDINSDRAHPLKQFRPFASGELSILSGFISAAFLFIVGIIISIQISIQFFIILILYFLISYTYSTYLKRIAILDVFILATLYTSRIIAGGIITDIPISFWLIAFSTFIFLSLAFVKRYSELIKIDVEADLKDRGREYIKTDQELLQIMGITCGFISVVVFTLYLDSNAVTQIYSKPKILWIVSFLLLYWISRIWIITNHGEMKEDPILFAVKDKTSYLIFGLIGLIFFLSL